MGPAGRSEHVRLADQVFLDHERHLEDDGVVELPEVQARELLDLLQAVDQGVAVDEDNLFLFILF